MSKALEALEKISKCDVWVDGEFDDFFGMFGEEYNILKNAIKSYEALVEIHAITISAIKSSEKSLKALEIIKKKRVAVDKLLFYLNTNACDDSILCWYNEYAVNFEEGRTLTEEEYYILKEVLKDD